MKKNLISAVLISLMLAACGGGGGGSSNSNNGNNGGGVTPPPPVAGKVVGTVAVGAPLNSATVTVKDSAGVVKTVTTDANGNYSLDTDGLKAPLFIEAVGIAGGKQFVVHSVVEAIASNGTNNANVTPLTDAVLTSAVGTNAADFFNNPDAGKIDPARLENVQNNLKQVISTLMSAAGVGNVDLIKTPFTPNKTGMDAVLETVSVQTTTTAEGDASVQIVNKFNPDQVVTITKSGNAGTISQSNLPNISSIDAFIKSFNAAVATADAVNTLFPTMFDDDYLEDAESKWQSVTRNQKDGGIVGVTFSDAVIDTCNMSGDICKISTTMTFASGVVDSATGRSVDTAVLTIKKQNDGTWKLFGNQQHHNFALVPTAQRLTRANNGQVIANKTGIVWYIDTSIGYTRSAILYLQNDDGTTKEIARASLKSSVCPNNIWLAIDTPAYPKNCSNFLELNDQMIAELTAKSANPKFKIVMYTDENYTVTEGMATEGFGIYSNIRMPIMPPLTRELAAAPFPELTANSVDNVLNFSNTGAVALAWNAKKVAPVSEVQVAVESGRTVGRAGLLKDTQATLSGNDMDVAVSYTANRTAYVRGRSADGRDYMQVYFGCKAETCN